MSLSPEERKVELLEFRKLNRQLIADKLREGGDYLHHALMGLGKTFAGGTVIEMIGDKQLTIYTKLWDTREQIKAYALEHTDLKEDNIKILPTLDRHCGSFETFENEQGNDVPLHPDTYRVLSAARSNGATASAIHENEKHLVCKEDGDCEYKIKMSFDPDDYDLIIGSPQHAHVETYNEGRAILIDEDAADSYEEDIPAGAVNKSINYYLKQEDKIDVNSKKELSNLDPRGQLEVLDYVSTEADMFDPQLAINTSGGRADSAALLRAMLEYETLPKSGFERANFTDSDGGEVTTVRDTQYSEDMTIRRPPTFRDRHSLVAMDGTPHRVMWEGRLGRKLEYGKVLDEEQTRYYVSDVLNYNVYQTSRNMNPYSSGKHASLSQIYALLEAVSKDYDQKVALITTMRVRDMLKEEKPRVYDEYVHDDRLYYNGLRSHSEYENYDLGVVAGCQFTGDRVIQRLAALDGHDVGEREGKGVGSSFGEVGDTYYKHESHASTAQAIFRFGRGEDVGGADIFVHTDNIPDWIPIEGIVDEGEKIRIRQSNEREVMMALQDLEVGHTATIEEMVDCSDDTVRRHLDNEAADGYVEKANDRGRTLWIDNGLENANWWGEVPLPN